MTYTRKSPAVTGLNQNAFRNDRSNSITDPYSGLLARLEGVQTYGKGCRAVCPACGGKSRKLSLTQSDDGRVLLHCFAGCAAVDVLAAVGMTVADLFVRRDLRNMTPAERSQLRQMSLVTRWRAALEVFTHEITVVLIAANQLGDGTPLNDDDLTRLRVAALRVFDCGEVLNAR